MPTVQRRQGSRHRRFAVRNTKRRRNKDGSRASGTLAHLHTLHCALGTKADLAITAAILKYWASCRTITQTTHARTCDKHGACGVFLARSPLSWGMSRDTLVFLPGPHFSRWAASLLCNNRQICLVEVTPESRNTSFNVAVLHLARLSLTFYPRR